MNATQELAVAIENLKRFAEQGHCWYLDDALVSHMAPFIQGHNVIDLGGGDGSLALLMSDYMKAKFVMVVEKERIVKPHPETIVHPGITWFVGYMLQFQQDQKWFIYPWDVAVLAFPPNQMPFGVTAVPILDRCKYVVVLGQNDGENASGPRQLWEYLTQRMLYRYIQHPRNDLLIYDNRLRPLDQQLVEHEKHGLTN